MKYLNQILVLIYMFDFTLQDAKIDKKFWICVIRNCLYDKNTNELQDSPTGYYPCRIGRMVL